MTFTWALWELRVQGNNQPSAYGSSDWSYRITFYFLQTKFKCRHHKKKQTKKKHKTCRTMKIHLSVFYSFYQINFKSKHIQNFCQLRNEKSTWHSFHLDKWTNGKKHETLWKPFPVPYHLDNWDITIPAQCYYWCITLLLSHTKVSCRFCRFDWQSLFLLFPFVNIKNSRKMKFKKGDIVLFPLKFDNNLKYWLKFWLL